MNKHLTQQFIHLLTKNNKNGIICWQGIRDKAFNTKGEPCRLTAIPYHFCKFDDELYNKMCHLNSNGYCVSIAINEFNERKRRVARDVTSCNAYVVDIDVPISAEELTSIINAFRPDIVVTTSNHSTENGSYSKVHLYWLIKTPEAREEAVHNYRAVQNAYALKIDAFLGKEVTDKGITIEKVMRIPGFLNHKYSEPCEVGMLLPVYDDDSNIVVDLEASPMSPTSPNKSSSLYIPQSMGNRHKALLSYACKLFRANHPQEVVAQFLQEANDLNTPPIEVEELQRIYIDALQYWTNASDNPSNVAALLHRGIVDTPLVSNASLPIAESSETPPITVPPTYNYGNRYEFVDTISDRAILYRLFHRFGTRIKGSKFTSTKVYNPSTGVFDEDLGDVDRYLNTIIVDMTDDSAVADNFMTKDGEIDSNAFRKYIINCRSVSKMSGLVNAVSAMKEFSTVPSEWDASPNLLNTLSGVIDLDTQKLHPHSPTYMMTKSIATTYDHDLSMQYEDMESRRAWKNSLWSNFILEIMDNNVDMAVFLQTLFGYALSGKLDAHCLAFFHGDGCNGKSVCLESYLKMLGTYGRSITNNLFIDNGKSNDNFVLSELAQLHGCRYVLADEIQDGTALDEAAVKNVTTGADLVAKYFFKDPFTFKPQFTSFLHGNHKPTIKGDDAGIWRRILMVPFEVSFLGRVDRDLPAKLQDTEELKHILAWSVAGYKRYQATGLNPPERCQEAKKQYRTDMNHIIGFIDAVLLPNTGAATALTKTSLVYGLYKYWCAENNQEPHSKVHFGRQLTSAKIESVRKTDARYYAADLTTEYKAIVEQVGKANLERENLVKLFN